MPTNVTLYTIDEVATLGPPAHLTLYEKWKSERARIAPPSFDEMLTSLDKVMEVLGIAVEEYDLPCDPQVKEEPSIGLRFREHLTKTKVFRLLKAAGFMSDSDSMENASFPGDCPLTGVCYDDDIAEAVWEIVKQYEGDVPGHPLEYQLAQRVQKMMLDEMEGWISIEEFSEDCERRKRMFTLDGRELK
jgi:hypothetical protein